MISQTCKNVTLGVAIILIGAGWILGAAALGRATAIAWDPSPDPEVASYNVYIGEVTDQGGVNMITVTNTRAKLNLEPGSTYWFFVTAVSGEGLESDPSKIIFLTAPEVLEDGK